MSIPFRHKENGRVITVIALLIFAVFSIGIFGYERALNAVADYLIVNDNLEKADIIIVLGGNPFDRATAAAVLFHKGFAPEVLTTSELIPEGFRLLKVNLTESEAMKKWLMELKVPEGAITAIKKSTSTYEDALVAKEYTSKNGIKSAIIVSSPYHMRRVKMTFNRLFKDTEMKLLYYPAMNADFSTKGWWKREKDLIWVNNNT
jgi:uncharacterized SAM-binding protein YcdF (DUF218 family)